MYGCCSRTSSWSVDAESPGSDDTVELFEYCLSGDEQKDMLAISTNEGSAPEKSSALEVSCRWLARLLSGEKGCRWVDEDGLPKNGSKERRSLSFSRSILGSRPTGELDKERSLRYRREAKGLLALLSLRRDRVCFNNGWWEERLEGLWAESRAGV